MGDEFVVGVHVRHIHSDEVVKRPSDVVAALHFLEITDVGFKFSEEAGVVLFELDVAKSPDLKSQRAAVGLGSIAGNHTVMFQPPDPRKHGRSTQAGLVAQILHGGATVCLQQFHQLTVQGVKQAFHLFRFGRIKASITIQTYFILCFYRTNKDIKQQIPAF